MLLAQSEATCLSGKVCSSSFFFFFQAEDGIRDVAVTGVQTCALPIYHHIQRERLSVGERMSDILAQLEGASGFVPFVQLFRPEEGRMGVTVTFAAVLELLREALIEIVQAEAYGPLHVRAASPAPGLRVVAGPAAAPEGADPRAPRAE